MNVEKRAEKRCWSKISAEDERWDWFQSSSRATSSESSCMTKLVTKLLLSFNRALTNKPAQSLRRVLHRVRLESLRRYHEIPHALLSLGLGLVFKILSWLHIFGAITTVSVMLTRIIPCNRYQSWLLSPSIPPQAVHSSLLGCETTLRLRVGKGRVISLCFKCCAITKVSIHPMTMPGQAYYNSITARRYKVMHAFPLLTIHLKAINVLC